MLRAGHVVILCVLALLMMGVVPQTEAGSGSAIAFTMVVHFLQWAPLTIIGLYYAAKLHVSGTDVSRTSDSPKEADASA